MSRQVPLGASGSPFLAPCLAMRQCVQSLLSLPVLSSFAQSIFLGEGSFVFSMSLPLKRYNSIRYRSYSNQTPYFYLITATESLFANTHVLGSWSQNLPQFESEAFCIGSCFECLYPHCQQYLGNLENPQEVGPPWLKLVTWGELEYSVTCPPAQPLAGSPSLCFLICHHLSPSMKLLCFVFLLQCAETVLSHETKQICRPCYCHI